MLEQARHPLHEDRITAARSRWSRAICWRTISAPARFDLVYSIGVLAEHVPLDSRRWSRACARWLRARRPLCVLDRAPRSASVPRTLDAASWLARCGRCLPAPFQQALRGACWPAGCMPTRRDCASCSRSAFAIESLERLQSEAHLHCLCVARRRRPAMSASDRGVAGHRRPRVHRREPDGASACADGAR